MNIIITGASRGIGYATALEMAKDANNTILAISRTESKLQELKAAAPHANIDYWVTDLTNLQTQELGEQLKKWSSVDILINNAGLLVNKPFDGLSPDDWQRVFAVNVFAPVALTRFLLPYMEKSTQAHIVNISSMGGFQGSAKFDGLSAYSASKGALIILTECLGHELSVRKVAVNCLALGAVQTEMLAQAFPGYEAPLSSEQMGEFVTWFATKGQAFFNGKTLPVSVSTP